MEPASLTVRALKPPFSEMLTKLQRVKLEDTSTTDVKIVCSNGYVPVHSAVLKVASSFFATVLSEYMEQKIRSDVIAIVMLDYDVKLVRTVIQMMYSGFAVTGEEDMDGVKEIMRLFQMHEEPSFSIKDADEADLEGDYLPVLYYAGNTQPGKVDAEDLSDHEVFGVEIVEMKHVNPSETQTYNRGDSVKIEKLGQLNKNNTNDVEVMTPGPPQPGTVLTVDLTDSDDEVAESRAGSGGPAPEMTKATVAENGAARGRRNDKAVPVAKQSSIRDQKTVQRKKNGNGEDDIEYKLSDSPPRREGLRNRPSRRVVNKRPQDDASSSDDEYRNAQSTSSDASYDSSNGNRFSVPSFRHRDRRSACRRSGQKPTPGKVPQKTPQQKDNSAGTNGNKTLPRQNPKPSPFKADMAEKDLKSSEDEMSALSTGGDDDDSDYIERKHQKFLELARKCGKCGAKYETAKGASECVTEKHRLVRCYFCFKVFKNTEGLFDHYKRGHKKAGKQDHLLCRFCQQAVSFKSVSTHVISNHLFDKSKNQSAAGRGVASFANRGSWNTSNGKPGQGSAEAVRETKRRIVSSDDESSLSDNKIQIKKITSNGKKIYKMKSNY